MKHVNIRRTAARAALALVLGLTIAGCETAVESDDPAAGVELLATSDALVGVVPARTTAADWCAPRCAPLADFLLSRGAPWIGPYEEEVFGGLSQTDAPEATVETVGQTAIHLVDFSVRDLVAATLFDAGHDDVATQLAGAREIRRPSDLPRALRLIEQAGRRAPHVSLDITREWLEDLHAALQPDVLGGSPDLEAVEAALHDGVGRLADVLPGQDVEEPESYAVRSVWIWEKGWTLQGNCVLESSDDQWCRDKCIENGYQGGSAKEAIGGLFGGCAGVMCSCTCVGSEGCPEGSAKDVPFAQM